MDNTTLADELEADRGANRNLDARVAVALYDGGGHADARENTAARLPSASDGCAAGTYWISSFSGLSLRTAPDYTSDRTLKRLALAALRTPAPAPAVVGGDVVEALRQARDDLLAVGNDYPGSSCQKWCTERAKAAWDTLRPWEHCPSTHCERTQECRSVNECSANKSTVAALQAQPAQAQGDDVVEAPAVAAERERCAMIIGAIQPDEDAAGCPATWDDFVQIAQCAIRAGGEA